MKVPNNPTEPQTTPIMMKAKIEYALEDVLKWKAAYERDNGIIINKGEWVLALSNDGENKKYAIDTIDFKEKYVFIYDIDSQQVI